MTQLYDRVAAALAAMRAEGFEADAIRLNWADHRELTRDVAARLPVLGGVRVFEGDLAQRSEIMAHHPGGDQWFKVVPI